MLPPIRTFLLILGIILISYAQGNPGDQIWQSILGGAAIGTYVALGADRR